jgi:hypothetical protein
MAVIVVCVASAGAAVTVAQANGEAPAHSPTTANPPAVLFMCPHGAATSVLASALKWDDVPAPRARTSLGPMKRFAGESLNL